MVLHIDLEIGLSYRKLNSLQDYFLQNCSSSTLTMCKSQINRTIHRKTQVPKKLVPGGNSKKISCQVKVCKKYPVFTSGG